MIKPKQKMFGIKSSCSGKIKHGSMLAAQYILDNMITRDKKSHLLEVYKCRFCNKYHIGHNNSEEINTKKKNDTI